MLEKSLPCVVASLNNFTLKTRSTEAEERNIQGTLVNHVEKSNQNFFYTTRKYLLNIFFKPKNAEGRVITRINFIQILD